MKKILSIISALMLTFAISGTAMAAKPSATITLDNPTPAHGDTIVLGVTTNLDDPIWTGLNCYQNGDWIMSSGAWRTFHADGTFTMNRTFTLDSLSWRDGEPANCTAIAYTTVDGSKSTTKVRGTLDFMVSP